MRRQFTATRLLLTLFSGMALFAGIEPAESNPPGFKKSPKDKLIYQAIKSASGRVVIDSNLYANQSEASDNAETQEREPKDERLRIDPPRVQPSDPQTDKEAADTLSDQVSRAEKIGPDKVAEGWVLPSELKSGVTYVIPGAAPFKVKSVSIAPDEVRVVIDDPKGNAVLILDPNKPVAPERTAAWQAAAVEVARQRGITPQRAALWFGLGELFRLTRPPAGDASHASVLNRKEAELWSKSLDEITKGVTGETAEQFSFRLIHRAYTGPVGNDGALTQEDLDNLSFVLLASAEKGLDLVRLGVASQRAQFTGGMGWEQYPDLSSSSGNLFGRDASLEKIPNHVDRVLRAALWTHGANIIWVDDDVRHLKAVPHVAQIPTFTIDRYFPRKERDKNDQFSNDLDKFMENPSLDRAKSLVSAHKEEIRKWLKECDIEISDSLVVIPAPSSSQAPRFLAQSITELFSDEGVEMRNVFEKRATHFRIGRNGASEHIIGGVTESFSWYDRVARAYIGTVISPSAGIKAGKNFLIVDDITMMGCTRDICGALAGLFSPKRVVFFAPGIIR
jgi:hypothetical protein